MQHTIDELLRKIQAMQDIAMLAPGAEYDVAHVTHLVEQVQAMAGDIFNDKTKHPKLKAKMENR